MNNGRSQTLDNLLAKICRQHSVGEATQIFIFGLVEVRPDPVCAPYERKREWEDPRQISR
jgi:hypothetical protein